MMLTMEAYLRQGKRELRRLALDTRVQNLLRVAAYGTGGLALSGAALGGFAQPVAMGVICGVTGWRALVMGLGAVLGSWLFWGSSGLQSMVWSVLGTLLALFEGKRTETEEMPLLIPAAAGLLVSLAGLSFQILWQEDTPLRIFLLRIAVATLTAGLSRQVFSHRDALTDWIAGGVLAMALAPVVLLPGLGLGYLVAGILATGFPFPAAALGGLGLDLAQVTAIPMGVVVAGAYFLRLIPVREKWLRCLWPGAAFLAVSLIRGVWDWMPLPGLLLGGAVGCLLPPRADVYHRRGEVGVAQVRLEMAAGVLSYTQQLLLETSPPPIDQEAILAKVRDRACAACSARSACRDRERLTEELLSHPLDFQCRKTGRVLGELRRGQEQLQSMKAQRQQQREYRVALTQQYQFLAENLRHLSDQLSRRGERTAVRYRVQVSARGKAREQANGDLVLAFPGTGCRYYILLCDGMGTGIGAAQEGRDAGELLRQLLASGFPAEQALQWVNSLLALRCRAGAVTVDLAELRLDTGRGTLHKWGAAPSYLLRRSGMEKLGKGGPPPGISVGDCRETVVRFPMYRGQTLVMASDGAAIGEALPQLDLEMEPSQLAQQLVAACAGSQDDATVAVVRLLPIS